MKNALVAAALCLSAVAAHAMNETPSKLVVRGSAIAGAPFRPPMWEQAVGDAMVTIDGEIVAAEGDFGVHSYAAGQRFQTSVVMNGFRGCHRGLIELSYPPHSFCSTGEPCPARASLPNVRVLTCEAR